MSIVGSGRVRRPGPAAPVDPVGPSPTVVSRRRSSVGLRSAIRRPGAILAAMYVLLVILCWHRTSWIARVRR